MELFAQGLFADRIGGAQFGKEDKIYKFEKIKRAKREAVKNNPGVELIDLGVGEPDERTFDVVLETLKSEAGRHDNRGYSDNGIAEFKEAAAAYLERVFGVSGISPEREVNHSIGSKPALAMIPAAFINPGDVTLMTVPGYPVAGTHTQWYGGEVYNIPLEKENGFLPDLESVPADIRKRAKLLVINYPNNPTGARATESFYKGVIEFALANNVVVVQDAAYAALSYDGKPLSFLGVPGAREVGVEIHSLSKSYNMTGWRMAFVAGNEGVVKAFAAVKDNYDSGQFKAIQWAAIQALEHPELTDIIKAKYERRLRELVRVLSSIGFAAEMPGGTFYLYVRSPKAIKGGRSFRTAEDFSQYLIKEKLISTVPWDDVGHFLRFSATFEAPSMEAEGRVIKEIERRFSGLQLEF
ncbi:MAG: LL-diaminopimelate aminotransferase [Spirochaetes bacterium ADurb.BinA120]|nr:MAG: LL-diaminopimelate aminotransferase [Spirochaetes bacterium ADurb.BinA120]